MLAAMFRHIFKTMSYISWKHETLATNPPIHVQINRINNRSVFRIKEARITNTWNYEIVW